MKEKVTAILLILCISMCFLFSCSQTEIEYYREKENYVDVEGVVSFVNFAEDYNAIYIAFSDLSYTFDDNCFKIVGDNLRIVKDKGLYDKLKVGSQVVFTSAPKYFGDGYVFPIVSITIDDVCFLEFEEGYTNWLSWLSM